MAWISDLGSFWLETLAWLVGLTVAFGILVRLTPCNPGMFWWKDLRAVAADAVYWFFGPLLGRLGRMLLLIAAVMLLFGGHEPQPLPLKDLPLGLQCLAILLIQDVILYWVHRAFHTRPVWNFHAVHHSPKVLDWTATVRFHPVNNLLEFGLADIAILLLGFSPKALLVLGPFNIVYSAMVHANLNWTFGPLRYVLASPVFHRWHHTTLAEGRDKNFASTFPILDVIFGTYYLPPGKLPEQFGSDDPDFPEGFWGQLVRPFRQKERPLAALLTTTILAGVTLAGGWFWYAAWSTRGVARPAAETRELQTAESEPTVPEPAPRIWGAGHLLGASAIAAVAVSPDGSQIAAGDEGGTVTIWDAMRPGAPRLLSGHRGRVSGVAFADGGRRVISGGMDGTLKVWDAVSGKEVRTITGAAAGVLSVAVSADGTRIVAGTADGMVQIWDATTGQLQRTLTTDTDTVTGVALSADGRRVVAVNFKTAEVWDADSGRAERTLSGHTEPVYAVAISPDGRRIATGSFDGTVKVWDGTTGREERTLQGHTDSIYAVSFGADGQRIASGGNDRVLKIWDAATGRQEQSLTGHTDTISGVAIASDGACIVSGSRDGTVKVWGSAERRSSAEDSTDQSR